MSQTERARQDIEINNLPKVKTLTLLALLPASEAGNFKKEFVIRAGHPKFIVRA